MPIAIGPFVDRYQDLSDVLTTSLADQDTFKWDAGSSKFVHSTFVSSFNTRTGAVTLTSGDVTTALGYTPPSGSGTAGTLPKWSASSVLTNSLISEASTTITAGGDLIVSGNIGLTGTAISATRSLNLLRSGTGDWSGANISLTRTDTGSSLTGLSATCTAANSSGTVSQVQAFIANARLTGAGTLAVAQGFVATASCSAAGAGVITLAEGIRGSVGVITSGNITTGIGLLGLLLTAAGTITTVNLVQARSQYAAGAVTSIRGLFVGDWTGNIPATDLDGILIDASIDAAAATNKFAFRSLSTSQSLFSGTINAAVGVDIGSAANAFRNLCLYGSGTYGSTSLQFTGTPTGNRVVTFIDATHTVARIDAGQTFAGTQVFLATISGSISGNAATVTTNANLTGPITSVGNATSIASQTGTGTKFVVDNTPTLITPVLGIALATSINGNTFTAGTYTLTGSSGKVLTFSNTLTLTAVDGSTLAIGGGGTLGTAAYTAASAYQPIDSDLTIVAAIGSALQQLRVNAGGTAIEYFTPAAAGLTIGTTTITSGSNTKVLFNNSGVVGEYTVTGSTNVVMSASPTLTGTVGLAALTATGTIVQTSASAAAFESGPNGGTNPVFRLVNSVASAATGLSVTGNASGSGVTLTALGGTNENINLIYKGTGTIGIGGGTVSFPALWNSSGTLAIVTGTNSTFAPLMASVISATDSFKSQLNDCAFYGGATNTWYVTNAGKTTFQKVALSSVKLWSAAGSEGTNDTGINRNAVSATEINNGTAGQWGSLLCGVRDAGTTTVTNGLTIGHQSTGTPAAGLGSALLFNINSSTTADQNAAQIAALWTTATHASRTSDLVFYTNNNAAGLAEGARLTGVKDFSIIGKLSTADPTSGAGPLWKLGTKKTAVAVTISPTDYVEIDIAGVVYKLGIVT